MKKEKMQEEFEKIEPAIWAQTRDKGESLAVYACKLWEAAWHAHDAEISALKDERERVTQDRDEWQYSTITANQRFQIAEDELANYKTAEPAMYANKHELMRNHFRQLSPTTSWYESGYCTVKLFTHPDKETK